MTTRNSFLILCVVGLLCFAYINFRESRSGEYRSGEYFFSLVPREGMSVKEFDEGGGAKTFIFEDTQNEFGFQIFAVPYADEVITEERFKMDVPSGVKENVRELRVDGVVATTFYSQSLELGETYEVWFVKGSLLYEVTTLRSLENELNEIINSWQFI